MTNSTTTPRTVKAAHLKGGDIVPGLGEVYDTGPAGDPRFTLVRVLVGAFGSLRTVALRDDADIELSN